MPLEITLPAELEQRVHEHVSSGLYGSPDEVVSEALLLLEACLDAAHQGKLAALRNDIAQGLEDMRHGRTEALDLNEIKLRGRAALLGKSV